MFSPSTSLPSKTSNALTTFIFASVVQNTIFAVDFTIREIVMLCYLYYSSVEQYKGNDSEIYDFMKTEICTVKGVKLLLPKTVR